MTSNNKKILEFIFVLVCMGALHGCSDSPSLNFVPDNGVILSFGDSLTVGVGAAGEHSYPNVLANLSGRKVIGSGVSGEETSEGLVRLASVLENENPNLLILLEGGNDILRNRNMQAIKKNLAAMIEMAQSRSIEVVLVGVPEKKLFLGVAPIYEELAVEYDLVFSDDLLSDLLSSNQYKSDAVHLNQQGYKKMAESIYDLLVEHGAL